MGGYFLSVHSSGIGSELTMCSQVDIDAYIPHCQYHLNPHSSPWLLPPRDPALIQKLNF